MLNFFFNKEGKKQDIQINDIYRQLKEIYCVEEIEQSRKDYLSGLMKKYGYLPYAHIKALEELSAAETMFCLGFKWKNESVFDGERFLPIKTSPLARRGIKNSQWIKKEGHDIKLVNLAALGNGNKSDETGKFVDWLKQLLILPVGVEDRGILGTTVYLIPFHEREFGCAYLPSSTDVSAKLEDSELKDKIGLSAKMQVQAFVTFAQLAGHPVIYDILPQTGRFAKIVLANPHIARWFDIKEFQKKVDNCIELVAKELERKYDKEDVEIVKDIYKQEGFGDLSEDYQIIYNDFDKELGKLKKTNSKEMMKKDVQLQIQKRVKAIVSKKLDLKPNAKLKEDDITKQMEIVSELMSEGLWTAPGGAWCSAGVPVFDKMSECGSYPQFKHYDYKDKDVSEFANLDCQTPFYFTFLENGQYNKQVIEFFIDFVKKIQYDYNFDGMRVDHVDHIIDEVSVKNGVPISYRIPEKVLCELNTAMKAKIPHFATLAEYILGGNYFKEYHQNMNFDLLWGNDVPAQAQKTPEKIAEDNQNLINYNSAESSLENLSILKAYNNQDGEYSAIDSYPGQLGFEGALFKWFKYKFLPGGKYAQRPVLYVDGDESFTKTGIERTICNEVSLKRANNEKFFSKFDAINRFAKSEELVTEGESEIIIQEDEGFVCWMISKEPLKSALLIVANYLPCSQREYVEDEFCARFKMIENSPILNKIFVLPGDYKLKSEFVFNGKDFEEQPTSFDDSVLTFDKIMPSEFRIFLLTK